MADRREQHEERADLEAHPAGAAKRYQTHAGEAEREAGDGPGTQALAEESPSEQRGEEGSGIDEKARGAGADGGLARVEREVVGGDAETAHEGNPRQVGPPREREPS